MYKIQGSHSELRAYDSTVVAWRAVAEGPSRFVGCFGLLRPHFTGIRSPSISKPLAHACAAVSATARSLKLINAHLNRYRRQYCEIPEEKLTHLVFSTCTTDLSCVAWMLGRDCSTSVRMLSSVEVGGREERKSDVWSNCK